VLRPKTFKELQLMGSVAKKQVDIARLTADLSAAKVELLSAQCAADRIRLQYSVQDIVAFGERHVLKRIVASAEALSSFCSQIEAQIKHEEDAAEQT
jgi:hypothetical protein